MTASAHLENISLAIFTRMICFTFGMRTSIGFWENDSWNLIFRPVRFATAVKWQMKTWRIASEISSQLAAVVFGHRGLFAVHKKSKIIGNFFKKYRGGGRICERSDLLWRWERTPSHLHQCSGIRLIRFATQAITHSVLARETTQARALHHMNLDSGK